MIRPPGRAGIAFSESPDGDLRRDLPARERASRALGISPEWATATQVHGRHVVMASKPGPVGEADAIWSDIPGLVISVFTADCFGVALVADGAVGVAHAGWRGTQAGVVGALCDAMTEAGHTPITGAVGPGIGPCCFEVGPEVAARFDRHHRSETTWGTQSVDLVSAVAADLGDLVAWVDGRCTYHDETMFSYRRDGTGRRLAAIGWVP